jgi:hypothetical protein
VQEAERVQRHPAAAAAASGQDTAQAVGQLPGRGIGEAVDRDMDRRGAAHEGDGVGERLHHLGAPSCSLGFDRMHEHATLHLRPET